MCEPGGNPPRVAGNDSVRLAFSRPARMRSLPAVGGALAAVRSSRRELPSFIGGTTSAFPLGLETTAAGGRVLDFATTALEGAPFELTFETTLLGLTTALRDVETLPPLVAAFDDAEPRATVRAPLVVLDDLPFPAEETLTDARAFEFFATA